MSEARELQAERIRVLGGLGKAHKTHKAKASLPDSAGIYTLWAAREPSLIDLGLEDVRTEPPLMTRPLYVGKDTRSVRKRLDKHFSSGDTGHYTLRRTLASLLDMESRPRRTGIEHPTPEQLRTLITNFDLTEADDERLTRWMAENLDVCGSASRFSPLGDVERAVGAILHPPLDQERSPMWGPNPWREQVKEARLRLRDRAQAAANAA